MVAKIGNKPIWQKVNGSVNVTIFKNKNVKGSVYPIICIQMTRYPLRFCRKIYLNPTEAGRLAVILSNLPETKIKEKNK